MHIYIVSSCIARKTGRWGRANTQLNQNVHIRFLGAQIERDRDTERERGEARRGDRKDTTYVSLQMQCRVDHPCRILRRPTLIRDVDLHSGRLQKTPESTHGQKAEVAGEEQPQKWQSTTWAGEAASLRERGEGYEAKRRPRYKP